jgi:hypothetical protein
VSFFLCRKNMCKNSSVQRFLCGKDPVLTEKLVHTDCTDFFTDRLFCTQKPETVARAVFTQHLEHHSYGKKVPPPLFDILFAKSSDN